MTCFLGQCSFMQLSQSGRSMAELSWSELEHCWAVVCLSVSTAVCLEVSFLLAVDC